MILDADRLRSRSGDGGFEIESPVLKDQVSIQISSKRSERAGREDEKRESSPESD